MNDKPEEWRERGRQKGPGETLQGSANKAYNGEMQSREVISKSACTGR